MTTVAPFGSTLIELDASGDCGIGDVGLATATNGLSGCILNERPPECNVLVPTLLELDISWRIDDDDVEHGRWDVRPILALNVSNNKQITNVAHCSRSLRHLVAEFHHTVASIGDAGLRTEPTS